MERVDFRHSGISLSEVEKLVNKFVLERLCACQLTSPVSVIPSCCFTARNITV